jgi:TolA-binding protein
MVDVGGWAHVRANGPFETANDLSRVPGINEKRISRLSNRIFVTPPNSGYRRSIVGVRSQDGGPRDQIERRMIKMQTDVADVSGTVHQLESQSTTIANSINALDARLTEQEQKTNPRAKVGSYATAKTPEKAPASTNVESPARRRVREAMNEFEGAIPAPAAAK